MDLDPTDPVTSGTDIPHWLQSPQQPTPDDPQPRSVAKSSSYPALFEGALERIMGGTPLATIIANDQRGIQLGRFLYWINRDPQRKARYEEACMIAAEVMAHELVGIADAMTVDPESSVAMPVMEDVQRSALRIKARTYNMEKWSPQRYGDSRRIQIDQTSLTMTGEDLRKMTTEDLKRMALDMANRGEAIDVEYCTVEPDERDAA